MTLPTSVRSTLSTATCRHSPRWWKKPKHAVFLDFVANHTSSKHPWKENAPFFGFSTQSPWLPIDDEHNAFSIDAQQQDPHSTLNFTREMLAWRQQQPALREGSCRILAFNKALMVFERHHESQTLVIAINGSNQEATIRLNLPSPAQTLPLPHMHVSAPTENDVLHPSPWQVWVGELHSN